LLVISSSLAFQQVQSQQSTVYASVVTTKLFVVGAANPQTGLFYQRPSDDTTWSHTGPNNIRAFSMYTDVASKGQVMYIASGNGLHKTTDGGNHWRITTGWEITEVLWVSPDPKDDNAVYIATAYGIYRTSDGCRTWKQMNSGLTSTFTTCVVVDHSILHKVYCATEDGVFGSDDGAVSWHRLGLSVAGTRVIVQNPDDSQMLVVGTESNGIYVSRNGGRWWVRSEAGVDHVTFYTIAFDRAHPDVLYAGGYVTGVYKSVDGGRSWKRVNDGLSVLSIHSIAVDPTNAERIYAATFWGGVFRSDNGGGLWRNVGLSGGEVWTILVQPY